jgi:hypothetical protein
MPDPLPPTSRETGCIPEDAQQLTAACRWCDWTSAIAFDAEIRHTCWAVHDPWVKRVPAIRISWYETRN